ncbi:MAG: tetratricopeptide repeat protein [Gammaproteobacteria bacterium]|nr:tetratricopeptide repeat protein [Gammaproteobacteria bacterium]
MKLRSSYLVSAPALMFFSACSLPLLAAQPQPAVAPPALTEPATGSELDAETLYDILVGELAAQRGDATIAAEALGRAARRTRDPRFAERATLAALVAKQNDQALQSAQLWMELQPASTDAREALATVLLELDKITEAREQFLRVLNADSSRANLDAVYLRFVGVLGRASNRIAALSLMRELVKVNPDVAAGHFALAHLAVRAGDLEAAEQAVDQALTRKPGWEDAALFKARILVSRNQGAQAQRYFEDFLKSHPKATNIRLHYARHLVTQKQWEQALTQFKRVSAETPGDAEIVYYIGLLALQTNRLEEAESYLKRAVELQPENDHARFSLGQLTERGKRYAEATRWYRDVNAGEYYFEAQIKLGLVMAKQGDVAKARAHLHEIPVESDQQRVQIALAEEQLLRDARQYREALDMLNDALTRLPGDVDLLYARALVAERLDMLKILEADLRAILKRDPKNVNALNALGYTLADRTDRYAEAQTLLNQALELKPDDPYVLDSIGWLFYRQGGNAEAIKYLKRALAQRSDAEIAAHLGEVLWVTGDRTEAESVWKQALHETPDNEALRDVIKKFKP